MTKLEWTKSSTTQQYANIGSYSAHIDKKNGIVYLSFHNTITDETELQFKTSTIKKAKEVADAIISIGQIITEIKNK